MKFLFRFYIVLILSTFVFSYYSYALDTNTYNVSSADPSNICSQNDGTLNPDFEITSGQNNFEFVDNFKYTFWKPWYKNDQNQNKDNYPYLMENSFVNGNVTLIYSYTNNNDNTFTLGYKQFNCSCPNGADLFGQCIAEVAQTKDQTYTTPTRVCSMDGKIEGATGELIEEGLHRGRWSYNQSQKTIYGREFQRNSDNETVVNYLLKKYNSDGGTIAEIITGYGQNDYQYVNYGGDYWINYTEFSCSCPYGNDEYGICKPLECTPPQIETTQGVCAEPDFCSDGGNKLGGFCDRSCEDLGMITTYIGGDTFDVINPEANKRCVSKLDCTASGYTYQSCVDKCGSADNIRNFPCDPDSGINSCECKDDSLDDIIDEKEPNEDTEAGDSLLTNKYLKSIKDEELKQSETLGEINSLLYTSNENDLTRENQLNSLDGKLDNIDNSINGLNNSIDGVGDKIDSMKGVLDSDLDSLKTGQDEGNSWLEDILNKLIDIYTFYTDLQNEVLTGTTNAQSELNDNLANIETVEDLDINNEVQGFLDTVVSKYSNALGFSTSYGTRPTNITVTLFEKEYTIIDFSVLDEHITVIRNLFLTIAYLSGFMMLLRKA